MGNRFLVRLGLAFAIVLVAGLAAWAAAGQPYTSPSGRYRVVFPSGFRPQEFRQREKTLLGEVDTFQCVVARRDSAYYTAYSDYPPDTVERAEDPTPVLEAVAAAIAENLKGSLQGKSPFTYRGYKGLSVSFTGRLGKAPIVGQANVILVRNRLYMIYALAPTGQQLMGQEARSFFSSFDLL